MEKKYKALRFFAYVIEILLVYIIEGLPGVMPDIVGSKPCMLIPVALTIAAFESEKAAMIFGIVCGILSDLGYGSKIGFFAISLCTVCFCIGFIARNLVVVNLFNICISGIVVISLILSLHFIFFYAIAGYQDVSVYFYHYIVKISYTFVFVPLFFYLNKLFFVKISIQ